jgi:hypothetical protein
MFSPARAYGYHGLQQWRGATDVTLQNVSLRLPATGAKRKQIIPRRTTATGSASRVPARLISGDAWRAPHLFSRKWTSTPEQTVTRFGIHF